jgi:hypothetical protein
MKKLTGYALIFLCVLTFAETDAVTVRPEASPLLGPGYIEKGIPFTIDIYMNNNDGEENVGYSMPFTFYSPDNSITTITHRNVGGVGPHLSILYLNDFDTFWTMMDMWTDFGFDGNLPDTINHTTATLTGWPPDLGEKLFLQFAMQIDQEGEFCIDSCSVYYPASPGTYDWIFDFDSPFFGPFCWKVVTEIPQNPEIGVTPESFLFEGMAGDPPPPPQSLKVLNLAMGYLNWTATWKSSWLSVSPSYGDHGTTSQIYANTVGLPSGTYYDTITISDPNATNSPVYVPVQLNLEEPPPVIGVSQDYFNFNAVADDANPPDQYLDVTNDGGSTLNWSAVNLTSWLTVNPSSGIDDAQITLSVDITGMTYGIFYDTITISDPQADNDPVLVEVRLEIASSLPLLALNPPTFYIAVDDDYPVPDNKQFEVINAGAGTMNFTLEEHSDRITSLTPSSGLVPQTVTIEFDTVFGGHGAIYYDTITVTSDEAVNSPQILPLEFHVFNDPARVIASRQYLDIEIYECGQGIDPFNFPSLSIYANGSEPFVFNISNSQEWLEISPETGEPPVVLDMVYSYQELAPGTYYDTVIVTAYNAINSPIEVPITLTILPTPAVPEIWTTAQNFQFTCREERYGRGGLTFVNNVNPGCMPWSVQDDISWVDFRIDSSYKAVHPWLMSVKSNGFGMTWGHYEDTAYIVAPDASNSPYPLYFSVDIWKYYGDVDYNGVINIKDITYLIKYKYRGGPPPIPEYLIGDVNCDYVVDIKDISRMIEYKYHDGPPLCGNTE